MIDSDSTRSRHNGAGKWPCRVMAIAAAFSVGLGMSGCRQEEQNRPLSFEPGKYSGQPDEPLSPEQREALRHRTTLGH